MIPLIISETEGPKSCDTFVALPPATGNGCVIFGKNSDRPLNEVQEVVFHAASQHETGSKLQVRMKPSNGLLVYTALNMTGIS